MSTSKWTNYVNTKTGSYGNLEFGDRNQLLGYSAEANIYKRLRHIKMSLAASVDTAGGLVTAQVLFWKGSSKLNPLLTTDLDLTDTRVFHRVPLALTDGQPFRWTARWPSVSLDEDDEFQIFIHYNDSNTVGGARPDWRYSFIVTAMENRRTM